MHCSLSTFLGVLDVSCELFSMFYTHHCTHIGVRSAPYTMHCYQFTTHCSCALEKCIAVTTDSSRLLITVCISGLRKSCRPAFKWASQSVKDLDWDLDWDWDWDVDWDWAWDWDWDQAYYLDLD